MVAQQVEEEHGMLDSYVEENDTGDTSLKREDITEVEEATYTLQVCG